MSVGNECSVVCSKLSVVKLTEPWVKFEDSSDNFSRSQPCWMCGHCGVCYLERTLINRHLSGECPELHIVESSKETDFNTIGMWEEFLDITIKQEVFEDTSPDTGAVTPPLKLEDQGTDPREPTDRFKVDICPLAECEAEDGSGSVPRQPSSTKTEDDPPGNPTQLPLLEITFGDAPITTQNGKKRYFYCPICGKEYARQRQLTDHTAAAHEGIRYQCPICLKGFSQPSNLKVHMSSVHEGKHVRCSVCFKKFTRACHLRLHVLSVHEREKRFSCPICFKQFGQAGNVRTHVATAHRNKPNSCSICTETFTNSDSLNFHFATVHKGKPFTCSICNKRFSQARALNVHVSTVHEGKRHSCFLCQKEFTQIGALNLHVATVHEEKSFSCDVCSKQFSRLGNLKTHMATLHEGKRVSCSVCSKLFTQAVNLRKHLSRVHGKDPP